MMTDAEKITTLIDLLENGAVSKFANKCGIRPDVLSRAKNSSRRQRTIFPRILQAYPNVRKEWLILGEGEPLLDMPKPTVSEIEALTKSINRLALAMEKILAKMN